jgi:hypothetical protein
MKEVRKDEPDASGILGSHTSKLELESAIEVECLRDPDGHSIEVGTPGLRANDPVDPPVISD